MVNCFIGAHSSIDSCIILVYSFVIVSVFMLYHNFFARIRIWMVLDQLEQLCSQVCGLHETKLSSRFHLPGFWTSIVDGVFQCILLCWRHCRFWSQVSGHSFFYPSRLLFQCNSHDSASRLFIDFDLIWFVFEIFIVV